MTFWIIGTAEYVQKYDSLGLTYKPRIEKFLTQLEEQGHLVGKPLSGLPFFREKKFNGNRLYYLVYLEWDVILVVDISDKKEQAGMILRIKLRLDTYKEFVRSKIIEKQST